MKYSKNIVILDVHASEAGALSILDDFIEQIKNIPASNIQWTVLVSTPIYDDAKNIKVKRFPWIKKSWLHRYYFERFVVFPLLDKIKPDLILNFQNIGINYPKCPQIVYLHLPFILTDYKFTLLRSEIRLWVYQAVLKNMILQSLVTVDQVIVQTKWMKSALLASTNISASKVAVLYPDVGDVFQSSKKRPFSSDIRNFFYPATSFTYKNHILILRALRCLKREVRSHVKVTFTLSRDENRHSQRLYSYCMRYDLPVTFAGRLPRHEVARLFKECTLIFPSFVESFGLPLLEARRSGAPVLAIDRAFSREILSGYKNVIFFSGSDAAELAGLMMKDVDVILGSDVPRLGVSQNIGSFISDFVGA